MNSKDCKEATLVQGRCKCSPLCLGICSNMESICFPHSSMHNILATLQMGLPWLCSPNEIKFLSHLNKESETLLTLR